MNKLNLGCGLEVRDGWVNVDTQPVNDDVLCMDILEGLDFPDNHFDLIMMNHVLQTFTYDQHEQVLKEVRRVLKPGGKLRIVTPNLVKAVAALLQKDSNYFPVADDIEPSLGGKFARYLYWHGETRSGFTADGLADLLARNGFIKPRIAEFGECELDSRYEESFIMEAQK